MPVSFSPAEQGKTREVLLSGPGVWRTLLTKPAVPGADGRGAQKPGEASGGSAGQPLTPSAVNLMSRCQAEVGERQVSPSLLPPEQETRVRSRARVSRGHEAASGTVDNSERNKSVHVGVEISGFICPDGKESACDVGDQGSIPGWGRSPGGGHGHPLQCSCLENPMDGGAR